MFQLTLSENILKKLVVSGGWSFFSNKADATKADL